jgi:hypothetical protein
MMKGAIASRIMLCCGEEEVRKMGVRRRKKIYILLNLNWSRNFFLLLPIRSTNEFNILFVLYLSHTHVLL